MSIILENKILQFIKQRKAVSIKNLQKQFQIGRTNILYNLNKLIKKELIEKQKKGRKYYYSLSPSFKIENYFQKKIDTLKNEMNQLITKDAKIKKRNKMILAFANYFDLLPYYKTELEKYYEIIDYSNKELYLDEKEFIYRTKKADVIVNNWACEIDKSLISKLPKLKYMHVSTHMHKYVDISALKQKSIHFSYMKNEYRTISLSEFAIAQTFALLKKVTTGQDQLKSGIFEFGKFFGASEQLRGKTIAIFGTDAVSKDLFSLLKNFNVEILVYNEKRDEDPSFWGIADFSSIKEIKKRADIVYIVNSTDNLFKACKNLDSNFLRNFSKPIFLITIAKHNFIDTKFIKNQIYKGILKGIAIDYFPDIVKSKNLKDSKINEIIHLPNVIITPDIAWYSNNSIQKMNDFTTKCLVSFAKGSSKYLLF